MESSQLDRYSQWCEFESSGRGTPKLYRENRREKARVIKVRGARGLKQAKLNKTKEAMTSYYKTNTKDLATLRDNFPKMKEDLDTELKQIVANLKEE